MKYVYVTIASICLSIIANSNVLYGFCLTARFAAIDEILKENRK